jgi:type IV pilus assembly protein PilQ
MRPSDAAGSRFRPSAVAALLCALAAAGAVLTTLLPSAAFAQGIPGGLALTPSGETAGGRATIHVEDRRLGDVLDYLRRQSDYNIVVIDEGIRDIKVTLSVDNVYWRDVLQLIAEKYSLELDESQIRARLIKIRRPPVITHHFPNTDIREIVTLIAEQARANVVMGESVSGRVTMHLEGIPWRDAIEMAARSARCVVVPERRGVIRVARPEELEAQMETRVFQLAYIQAEGGRYRAEIKSDFATRVEAKTGLQMSLQEVLEKVKSEKGTVAPLRGTSSLVVTDTPQKLEVIERLVNQIDRPPKQVHLSVKIIELSDIDAENIGMKWSLTGELSGGTYSTNFPFKLNRDQVTTGTLSFSAMKTVVEFIRTQTNARIIQAPQLIALDHEEATIHVGEVVRFAESFETVTPAGTSTGFREADNSPVRLGIQLLVIPHVTGTDNNVLLTVIPKTEQAGVPPFEEFTGGGFTLKLPKTRIRTVVTKMMLRDRETGIIAGLRAETSSDTLTKVPLLGDIPLLGWLFRHRSRPSEKTNLLILVTPTVIDFEKKSDIGEFVKRSQQDLGRGFSLEEEAAPRLLAPAGTPGAGAVGY